MLFMVRSRLGGNALREIFVAIDGAYLTVDAPALNNTARTLTWAFQSACDPNYISTRVDPIANSPPIRRHIDLSRNEVWAGTTNIVTFDGMESDCLHRPTCSFGNDGK